MLRRRNIGTGNIGRIRQGPGGIERNEEEGSSCLAEGIKWEGEQRPTDELLCQTKTQACLSFQPCV